MTVKRSSSGLMRAAVLFCLLQVAGACGEVKDDRGPVVAGTGGKIDVQGGSSGVANGVGGRPNGEAGLTPGSAGGAAAASSAGAGHPGITAGTGGDVPELPNAGAMGDAQAGFAGASGAAPVVGLAADFTLRARAAMNSAAPQWTCQRRSQTLR